MEKKIEIFEKGKKSLITEFKAKEEIIVNRDENLVIIKDRVRILTKGLEKRELTIIIIVNGVKLSDLPSIVKK